MKKIINITLLMFTCANYTFAQVSLIQDGSFEDTISNGIATYALGEGNLKSWHTFGNKINVNEFLHFSTYSLIGHTLPLSTWYNTYPVYGQATIYLLLYLDWPWLNANDANQRTIVRNKLYKPLIAGKQYCLSYSVIAPRFDEYIYTSGLQFYFDNGQLDTVYTIHKDSSGRYPFVQPQITNNTILSDSANWTKFEHLYTATGNETYLTIGNFRLEVNTPLVVPSWTSYTNSCRCHDVLMDNISLIPTDITNWLTPTYYQTTLDSVWVGLDKFDYPDGKWFTNSMQYISTGPGFWVFPPYEVGKKFIHEIDVCGVSRYDTTEMMLAPLGNQQLSVSSHQLKVWPNPASEQLTINNEYLVKGLPIQILDVMGKEVYHQIPKEKFTTINTSAYTKGVYLVKYGTSYVKLQVE